MWRREAEAMGFPGIYLVSAQTFGHRDPGEFGFDAAMEFPPHYSTFVDDVKHQVAELDPNFTGFIYDYEQAVANSISTAPSDYKVFPTATLSWDNTARKGANAHIAANFSVTRYSQWLSANAERVSKDKRFSEDEKLIFVNAWNEWAEGTHLEPDQKHGFGYLEATRRVMAQYGPDAAQFIDPPVALKRTADMALIIHLHFSDVWPEFAESIRALGDDAVDIYATATSVEAAILIVTSFPQAYVELVDNRGRDIRPFLHIFGKIYALGYEAICKVHGKKSLHRADGAILRKSAFLALLQSEAILRLKANLKIGLLVPADCLMPHNVKNMASNEPLTIEIAKSLGLKFSFNRFPAGSMFWFRPDALKPLLKIASHEFDVERGMLDGTRPHAIERLFANICEAQGYSVEAIVSGKELSG
jgi:lipopolysaccharide biosynthesis protein